MPFGGGGMGGGEAAGVVRDRDAGGHLRLGHASGGSARPGR